MVGLMNMFISKVTLTVLQTSEQRSGRICGGCGQHCECSADKHVGMVAIDGSVVRIS